MSFCVRCGTAATGAYCGTCGTRTPALDGSSAPDDVNVGEIAHEVVTTSSIDAAVSPASPTVTGEARRILVLETRFVMFAFLFPVILGAVIVLARHVNGAVDIERFTPLLKGQPAWNLVLGILDYVTVAVVVPLTLFLLWRTGQSPRTMGLEVPKWRRDVLAGLGLAAGSFAAEFALLVVVTPFLQHHPSLVTDVALNRLPKYYVIYGLAVSAITAVAEEVLVNGYLLTRLHQLGWSPKKSLALSLFLRTSYHVYYGIGFLFTVPFGYFATRSFQKHHKLNRPIMAHFLFDAVIITIAILR